MKWVASERNTGGKDQTFSLMDGIEQVATITLYDNGLLEFWSRVSGSIAVESIGARNENLVIDQMEIKVRPTK